MARSLIQTANPSTQSLIANSVINLGTVLRRYGCNLRLSGNGIETVGEGYYEINATVTVEPTAIGNVTVTMLVDGNAIPAAIASGYASVANTPVTLPIIATIRKGCRCDGASNITFVLTEGDGDVTNISVRVIKS